MTPIDAIGWLSVAILTLWLLGCVTTAAAIMYLVLTEGDDDE